MSTFIGIDPGVNGGIAILSGESLTLIDMPPTAEDLYTRLKYGWDSKYPVRAVIEKVTGYIPKGKTKSGGDRKHGGQPGSSMFELGINYGWCQMCLVSLGFSDRTSQSVAPITWQKSLGINIPPGLEYDQRKRELHSWARRLIPDTKISRQCADAALLALYAQRLYQSSVSTSFSEKQHG